MRSALTLLGLGLATSALATVTIDGHEYHVVDPHLHTLERVGDLNLEGKAFIIGQLPGFVVPYYPAVASHISDPYDTHIGIQAQLEWAGVDRGVLLATYTHHTVGFMTNRALEEVLDDPRNSTDEGEPWAYGMASINLDESPDVSLMADRLEALASYLEARPDRFIGVKLAHAHQGVEMNDSRLDQVYEVAGAAGVPVLLHTGVSPFPGTFAALPYTSPGGLEAAVVRHSGKGEEPRVEFVLSHIGSGDARAVLTALDLAERYDNVWLELSALKTGLMFDERGRPVEDSEPQYPWVLAEIQERGLIGRALFATDGPQSSGKVREYLGQITSAMQALSYSPEEMAAVLSENFYRCFFPSD